MEDDPCIYHVSRRNAFVPFMHAESDHVADDKDGSLRPAEGADTVLIVDDEGSGPDYNTESTTGYNEDMLMTPELEGESDHFLKRDSAGSGAISFDVGQVASASSSPRRPPPIQLVPEHGSAMLMPPPMPSAAATKGVMIPRSPSSSGLRHNSNSFTNIIRTRRQVSEDPAMNVHNMRKQGNDAMECIVSALYCKLLVILGLAFPLAEVISQKVPRGFYQFFYVYLFLGSLLFLLYIYIDLLRTRTKAAVASRTKAARKRAAQSATDASSKSPASWILQLRTIMSQLTVDDRTGFKEVDDNLPPSPEAREMERLVPRPKQIYGSFYIRMGAVLFGMGGLIYSGIEVGVFFEIGFRPGESKCNNFIILVRPFLQMAFVFIQMYFIFLNHKMNIYKNKLVSRFGLMHMIATNLCVWFNVLILETFHEIEEMQHQKLTVETATAAIAMLLKDVHHTTETVSHHLSTEVSEHFTTEAPHHHSEVTTEDLMHHVNLTEVPHHGYDTHASNEVLTSTCLRSDVMGGLLASSAPFLFPCTIEYSLICAAVLYMMWKNVRDEHENYKARRMRHKISFRMKIPLKMTQEELAKEIARNHYTMDCSRANNGLFCGLFIMVFTIISLIVFFVLITSENEDFHKAAITVASMTELTLYSLTTLAVIIGMWQVRSLWYDSSKKLELDNLLLVVAQTGVLIYSSFCIIGAYFQWQDHVSAFFASVVTLIQTTLQTLFILDASNRFAYYAEQVREKPGRQVVTFLLVCNLAMWAINTLETNRADSHPIQVKFYGGEWVWPIITHVSMPLAIFYRFHSTVCLCEIWTRSFKYKEYNFDV